MSAERTHALINPIYHQVYGVLQQFKFLGAWNRCLDQHSAAIREHFFPNKIISVLYCGTATKRNPIDVMAFMQNIGMSPNITTIDLSGKPIDSLDRHEFSPAQANCKSLPFADKSFDYITTDFLLSKMDVQSVITTVQEWGRVIKNSGLITLTVGLTDGLKITDNFYKAATPLYGIHFLSKETLRLIFQSAELEIKFGIARFDQKPHLYLYPNNLLMFLEARPLGDKNQQNAENAQMLLSDAKFIYDTILSEKHLAPVGLEEIIRGILARDFVIKKSPDGEIIGFIRLHKLTESWTEIGSLYIRPFYRNTPDHYGTQLLQEAINLLHKQNKNSIVFTDQPMVIKTLNEAEGNQHRMVPLNIFFPILRDRTRNIKDFRYLLSTLISGSLKSIYVLPSDVNK